MKKRNLILLVLIGGFFLFSLGIVYAAWCDGADINRDERVDMDDLEILDDNYGDACSSPEWCKNSDINRDGGVGIEDFHILAWNYRRGCEDRKAKLVGWRERVAPKRVARKVPKLRRIEKVADCDDPDGTRGWDTKTTITVTDSSGTEEFTDYCNSDGKLVEYACYKDGTQGERVWDCGRDWKVCEDGACVLKNKKNLDIYSDKETFLISDADWHAVLPMVPVSVWTQQEGVTEDCQRGYGTPDDVCVYPMLVWHDESGLFPFLSIGEMLFATYYIPAGSWQSFVAGDDFIQKVKLRLGLPDTTYQFELQDINGNFIAQSEKYTTQNLYEFHEFIFNAEVNQGETYKLVFSYPGITYISPDNPYPFGEYSNNAEWDIEMEIHSGSEIKTFDADSIIYFFQQYSPDRVTLVGGTSQEIDNLLIADPEFGAGLDENQIQRINSDSYLDYWISYKDVVYVEDDYELALLASTYASFINAPLVIEGYGPGSDPPVPVCDDSQFSAQWFSGSCPAGWEDVGVVDDGTPDTNHDVCEKLDQDGAAFHSLCLKSDCDLQSEWQSLGCNAGWVGTGLTDDNDLCDLDERDVVNPQRELCLKSDNSVISSEWVLNCQSGWVDTALTDQTAGSHDCNEIFTQAFSSDVPRLCLRQEADIIPDSGGNFDLNGRNIICVGTPNVACNEQYTLEQLQQKYVDMTNTDKVILVNPGDLNIKVEEEFQPDKSNSRIRELYSKTSLVAPVLAGAKQEVIISTSHTNYIEINTFIEDKISNLNINPEYLTIIASPSAIPNAIYNAPNLWKSGKIEDSWTQIDGAYYADLDSDYYQDLAVGRIYSYTISDISSYISRAVFYDGLSDMRDSLFLNSLWGHYPTTTLFGTKEMLDISGFSTNLQEAKYSQYFDLSGFKNRKTIYYDGHANTLGGQGGFDVNSIRKDRIFFDNSLISNNGCAACTYQTTAKSKLFCVEMIRRGAIGVIAATDVTFSNRPSVDLYWNLLKDKDLGTAFRDGSNIEPLGPSFNYPPFLTLLADPTLRIFPNTNLESIATIEQEDIRTEGNTFYKKVNINLKERNTEIRRNYYLGYNKNVNAVTVAHYSYGDKVYGFSAMYLDEEGWNERYSESISMFFGFDNPQNLNIKGIKSAKMRKDGGTWLDVTDTLFRPGFQHYVKEEDKLGLRWVSLKLKLNQGGHIIGRDVTRTPNIDIEIEFELE